MHETFQFNITQVAVQVGVAPATLRNWEKRGIFIPKRSDSGYRVFSVEDIETLQRIKSVSKDKNLNVEAIKMMACPPSHTPEESDEEVVSKQVLGERWRRSRMEKGYTLEQVAQAVGVSISYISKIENAQANVSFAILQRLAQFYGESVLFYYQSEKRENPSPVTRKGKGEKISIGLAGVSVESLGPCATPGSLNMKIYTVRPGCGQMIPNQHNGEEAVYVLSGQVIFTLGETEAHEIRAGDCIQYPSQIKHQWKNNGTTDAVLLWSYTPFSFPNL